MNLKNIKESGILIFFFLFFLFIGPSLFFFLKVPILKVNVILYFISACLFYHFLVTHIKKKKIVRKEFLKTIGLSLGIILVSLCICSFLFDRSSDGDTYHKDAIGVFKEGFNPVYESSESFIKNRIDDSKKLTTYSIWTDHYAKANWIIAANLYSFTGNIESAKAMNILSIYVLFTWIFFIFESKWGRKKALLFASIVCLNPITANQIYTFYNDFLVCVYLFLSILLLLELDKKETKELWIYYSFAFILLANLKFNGLGYLLVFSFFFMCRKLYIAWKDKNFKKTFLRLASIFIPLFIFSLLIFGYPTYVKNTLDHKTPFFPLYGEGKQDIMTQQQPKKFLKMTSIEKLFYSTFSKANNLRENENLDLKLPFTVFKSELTPSTSYDLRISGFGVWFSGLLCISIFILILYYPQYKKDCRILFTLLITTLLLIIMEESWWARYTPHFYLFVIISSYLVLEYGFKKQKLLNSIYLSMILCNVLLPFTANSYYVLKNSYEIHKELRSLKNKKIALDVHGYHGIVYNFKDYKIKYQLKTGIEKEKIYYEMVDYEVISVEK